jgi:hypothetical protein
LRLPKPIAPIAATLMDAPAIAATTSIMVSFYLLTLAATKLPAMGRLAPSAISLPRQLGLPWQVLQWCGAGLTANGH